MGKARLGLVTWLVFGGVFLQACTYSLSGHIDVGQGKLSSDSYNLARVGGRLAAGIVGVPASLGVLFSRESDSGGAGVLKSSFQQNYNLIDLNAWLPFATWQPYAHIGTSANEFNGLSNLVMGYSGSYNSREIGLGVRLRRALTALETQRLNYGYAVEGFYTRGSMDDVRLADLNTYGIRVSVYIDTADFAARPMM